MNDAHQGGGSGNLRFSVEEGLGKPWVSQFWMDGVNGIGDAQGSVPAQVGLKWQIESESARTGDDKRKTDDKQQQARRPVEHDEARIAFLQHDALKRAERSKDSGNLRPKPDHKQHAYHGCREGAKDDEPRGNRTYERCSLTSYLFIASPVVIRPANICDSGGDAQKSDTGGGEIEYLRKYR